LRDDIATAFRSSGHAYLYDFSIPMKHFNDFTEIVQKRLGDRVQHCTSMGHLADGMYRGDPVASTVNKFHLARRWMVVIWNSKR
jgi:hypothetical protein